jgi:hypothetical protein
VSGRAASSDPLPGSSGACMSTLDRVLQTPELVAAGPGDITPKAIGRQLGVSLSSVYYLLNSPWADSFVEQHGPGLYTLEPMVPQLYDAHLPTAVQSERLEPFLEELRIRKETRPCRPGERHPRKSALSTGVSQGASAHGLRKATPWAGRTRAHGWNYILYCRARAISARIGSFLDALVVSSIHTHGVQGRRSHSSPAVVPRKRKGEVSADGALPLTRCILN